MLVILTATLDRTYTVEYNGKVFYVENYADFLRIRQTLTHRCKDIYSGYTSLIWIWSFLLPTTH